MNAKLDTSVSKIGEIRFNRKDRSAEKKTENGKVPTSVPVKHNAAGQPIGPFRSLNFKAPSIERQSKKVVGDSLNGGNSTSDNSGTSAIGTSAPATRSQQ